MKFSAPWLPRGPEENDEVDQLALFVHLGHSALVRGLLPLGDSVAV